MSTTDTIHARDLRKGALVTLMGYVVRIAHPVLLVVVTQTYGAGRYGMLAFGIAVLSIVGRFTAFGIDRSLVYWIPKHITTGVVPGLRHVVQIFIGVNAVVALLLCAAASWQPTGVVWSTDSWIALGLFPLMLSELFTHMAIGLKRLDVQLYVRDAVQPIVLVGSALGFYELGFQEQGLGMALLLSYSLGATVAIVLTLRLFRNVRWSDTSDTTLPLALRQYAAPLWLSDMVNVGISRTGELMLKYVVGDAAVGIYDIARQFGNTVRSVRGSFDQLVTAVVSSITEEPEDGGARLADSFTYATLLVYLAQLPIAVFLCVFAPWLLALFGAAFVAGVPAVWLLCGFSVANGLLGLSGTILNGKGATRLSLKVSSLTLALQTALLLVLTPLWGVTGTATALGIGFLAQGLFQFGFVKHLTGRHYYTHALVRPLIVSLVAMAAGVAAFFVVYNVYPHSSPAASFSWQKSLASWLVAHGVILQSTELRQLIACVAGFVVFAVGILYQTWHAFRLRKELE